MDTNFYPPQNNGPHTTIAATINASQTSITVANAAILPDAPNVLTIGTEEDAELVLMESKTGNILAVQRGYNGTTAKAWDSGAWIYRAITAQDVQALQKRQENYMLRLTAEEYEARTIAQRQQDYADGVRGYLVGSGDSVRYGYVLNEDGTTTPQADPGAVRVGETVKLAKETKQVISMGHSEFVNMTNEQRTALYADDARVIVATDSPFVDANVTIFLLRENGTYAETNNIPHNYLYDGRDLSTVFASAEELHNAVAAGDFSKINIGDYWPITLNGNYTDCGESTTKTLSNAVVKMEVAGIDTYLNYGNTAITAHHLVMCSRDLLPNTTKWRKENTTWYNTGATNPWLGSAIYATLNVGILPLVQKTDIGAYIFAGPNGNGMRFIGETKAASATAATSWSWLDRGRLFLPTEREVWGQGVWSEMIYGAGLALQWPLFAGSLRHVVKGLGNGGSRKSWWLSSSCAGTASNACLVNGTGYADHYGASNALGLALCFLLV